MLSIVTFLLFVEDSESTYARHWISPFGWLHEFFFMKLPHRVRPFDHIAVICLLIALSGVDGKGPRVAPMRQTLLLSAGTVLTWFALGLARGGDITSACWQIYIPMSGVLFAFMIAAAFKTPRDFVMLAKVLLCAAAYRAVMCWIFYFSYVRARVIAIPEYITTHDDSVVWVVAMLILILRFYVSKSTLERIGCVLFMALLAGAIQFNTRRLAWVSLAMGLVVFFVLLPQGKSKRKATKMLLLAAPGLAIYFIVGWGRTERIFKPLQAFYTITTNEDASTKSRNVENLGLIHTASSGWLAGTGWGHQYIPVSNKYDLSQYFALWRYIPHNSVLGLFAFMGALGFFGYWLAFPTAMFLNARLARLGTSALARQVGLIGAVQMVVCVNQYFGDMGIFSYKVVYVMSTSFAIALRLPILAGAWPSPVRSRAKAKLEQPATASASANARERGAWQS
jgi:hypothetical protein